MLGISLTEFAVIACVAVIFIKPQDMPVIIKTIKVLMRKVSALKKEYSSTITKLQKEFDVYYETNSYTEIISCFNEYLNFIKKKLEKDIPYKKGE